MKKIASVIIFSIMIFSVARFTCAQEEGALIAEGKYFSLYACGAVDLSGVLTKVNFNYLLHEDSFVSKADDTRGMLAGTLDGLYGEVSDILDIHMYTFHGSIRVVADKDSLSELFRQSYGVDIRDPSVYVHEKNTIYISLADLTIGMLGHEIAHAIISHYFVVPPPVKVQEVLSGYVEYNLRKSRNSLP
ncbi:MAG: hypothetical protein WC695_10330 [Candidatus Omnitrophota bacterium]